MSLKGIFSREPKHIKVNLPAQNARIVERCSSGNTKPPQAELDYLPEGP